jgi:hypothetical protein
VRFGYVFVNRVIDPIKCRVVSRLDRQVQASVKHHVWRPVSNRIRPLFFNEVLKETDR